MGFHVFGILGIHHQLKKIHSVLEEGRNVAKRQGQLLGQKRIKMAEFNLLSDNMPHLSKKKIRPLLLELSMIKQSWGTGSIPERNPAVMTSNFWVLFSVILGFSGF
jgi:hypothetical protein